MKTIANILWVIFGGLELSVFWALAGLALCLSVVGAPFGLQCFKFAGLMLSPLANKWFTAALHHLLFSIFFGLYFSGGSWRFARFS